MQDSTRKTLFISLAVVFFLALGIWWYSGFSLDFMRFFAAEPSMTDTGTKKCQARPACLDAKPACDIAEPAVGWCKPGCYYQQIQCITTPCDPILVCPSPGVTPPPNGRDIVSCSPATQTVKVGSPATLTATGGDGTYAWFSPAGNPTSGSTFGGGTGTDKPGRYDVTYNAAGTKKVTVQSGRSDGSKSIDNVACTVIVTP